MKAETWRFESNRAHDATRERGDFLRHLRSTASADSDFEAAALVYGELVANVIRHADGPICVAFEWCRDAALLRVTDRGSGFFANVRLPNELSETGRGLYIVKQLARKLEVDCSARGCTVTVELPLRRARNCAMAG